MTFDTFSRVANEIFDAIPEEFRRGVDGLRILEEALPHPTLPQVYTLGHCDTEAYPSDWSGPDTTRSVVTLLYGSFRRLAELDPYFDWEEELWETLTHELRHHLETLADEDALEGVDYAMEEAFRRADGETFDPFYYQAGLEVAEGLFQVEYDFFLEQVWRVEEFEATDSVGFSWHGVAYRVPRPEILGDLHYLWVRGVEVGPGALQIVLVRKRGWRERCGGRGSEEGLELWESEGVAEPVP